MRLPNWPRWVWRCYAATAAAVGAFVVCSLIPMWDVWWIGQWCSTGKAESLWGMIGLVVELSGRGGIPDHCQLHWQTPAAITAGAMHVVAVAGAILGGLRRRKGTGGEVSPQPHITGTEAG
jgi:hypothetical protein